MGVALDFTHDHSLCFSQGEYWWTKQVLISIYFIASKVAGASKCDVSTKCDNIDYVVAAHICVHNIMAWCNATVWSKLHDSTLSSVIVPRVHNIYTGRVSNLNVHAKNHV